MTPANLAFFDLPVFIHSLRQERYPTILVHGPPLSGKTRFARQLASQTGWAYLDLLSVLSTHPSWPATIDQFDVPALRAFLLERATAVNEVLLIDELDFLFPLLGDLRPFQEMVRALTLPTAGLAFAFFVQSRPEWENWSLLTAGRQSRIIPFQAIKPL